MIYLYEHPWYDLLFVKAHTEIECDPSVWDQLGALIRSKLPEPGRDASAG